MKTLFFCMIFIFLSCSSKKEFIGEWENSYGEKINFSNNGLVNLNDTYMFKYEELENGLIKFYRPDYDCIAFKFSYSIKGNELSIHSIDNCLNGIYAENSFKMLNTSQKLVDENVTREYFTSDHINKSYFNTYVNSVSDTLICKTEANGSIKIESIISNESLIYEGMVCDQNTIKLKYSCKVFELGKMMGCDKELPLLLYKLNQLDELDEYLIFSTELNKPKVKILAGGIIVDEYDAVTL